MIDKDCWGEKQLQRAFTKFLVRCRLRHPWRRIYWFLISKGFKTYLLMRNNFASWPNHREATPDEVRAVLDRARPRGRLYVVDDTSHVFPRHARTVAARVGQAVREMGTFLNPNSLNR